MTYRFTLLVWMLLVAVVGSAYATALLLA